MTQAQIAERIARKAHQGQFRHDGITPYIYHVGAVVQKLEGQSDNVIATAWLHDVLEDTSLTVTHLQAQGINEEVCHAVLLLTRTAATGVNEYNERVGENEIARKVKIADIQHNISDKPTSKQLRKYANALLVLATP